MHYEPEGKYYAIKKEVYMFRNKDFPFYKKRPMIWKIYLSNNPSQSYFDKALDNYELQNVKNRRQR